MRGWDTVTIPGAVSGWAALSQRYGELPFADLFEPAIRYARDGFAVSPTIARKMAARSEAAAARSRLRRALPAARARARSRRACSRARRWRARSRASRESHGDGVLPRRARARRWCDTPSRNGERGHTLADFAEHTVDWVEPLAHRYRGVDGARDSAERPGHRRADGARHAASTSTWPSAAATASKASTLHRGDEARVRRCATRYVSRSAHDERVAGGDARPRLPRAARAQLIDPQRAQDVRSRRAAARRHRLPCDRAMRTA